MIRIIIILAAVYFLYKIVSRDWLKKLKNDKEEERKETERKVAAGEMVKDPECGAYVAVDQAVTVRDGDNVYYFCGYDCRDKFLERLENRRKTLGQGGGG